MGGGGVAERLCEFLFERVAKGQSHPRCAVGSEGNNICSVFLFKICIVLPGNLECLLLYQWGLESGLFPRNTRTGTRTHTHGQDSLSMVSLSKVAWLVMTEIAAAWSLTERNV